MNGDIATMPRGWMDDGTMYVSSIQGGSYERFGVPSCGPRCGLLNITQISNLSDIHAGLDPWFYICRSTVHEVEDAVLVEEQIPDHTALLAATSMSRGTAGDSVGRTSGFYPYK